jgi:tetratricopeptide (TPR) repeat protein
VEEGTLVKNSLVVQRRVASALIGRGDFYTLGDRYDTAIKYYNSVVRKYGRIPDRKIQFHVGTALVKKGHALNKVKKPEEAIATYKQVVKRFGDKIPNSDIQRVVVEALSGIATTLHNQHKYEKAATICANLVARFGETSNDDIKFLINLTQNSCRRE